MSQKRKLLVVLRHRFWDQARGSSVRIHRLLEDLAEDFDIDIFFLKSLSPKDINLIRSRCPFIQQILQWKKTARFPWDHVRAFSARLTFQTDRSRPAKAQPENFKDWLISHGLSSTLRRTKYDVVLFEYIWTAKFVNPITQRYLPAELWLDTHDVVHQRHTSSLTAGIPVKNPLDAKAEAAFLTPFSRLIAIQSEEAEEFRRLAPDKEIVTIPVISKVDQTPHPRPVSFDIGVINILHVSSRDPIAVKSLRWFSEEVWKPVIATSPGIHLHIVGSICNSFEGESIPEMTFHGFVDELAPFYQHSDLAINPCLAGSGLKIKTTEALAFQLTTLTTPFGAQGLDPNHHPQLIVCDPDHWINALITTIKNLCPPPPQ